MESVTFQGIVQKGNNKGVGFIKIPKEIKNNFEINNQIKVILNSNILFYAKIRRYYSTLGFYVPYKIIEQHKLINKLVNVEFASINGFYSIVGSDGRVYIPNFNN